MSNPTEGQGLTIRVSDVHAMLDAGKTREEIQAHYGLSKTQLQALFREDTLKNRKAKKPLGLNIVSDYTPTPKKTKTPTQPEETEASATTSEAPTAEATTATETLAAPAAEVAPPAPPADEAGW